MDVVPVAVGVMQRPVGDHPARHVEALHGLAAELHLLLARQLVRDGEHRLAAELRVGAALGRLDLVPERRAVEPALGRVLGQVYLRMQDALLSGVVVHEAVALAGQLLRRAVRGAGDRRAPAAARDDLDAEVIRGQGVLPSGGGFGKCAQRTRSESRTL